MQMLFKAALGNGENDCEGILPTVSVMSSVHCEHDSGEDRVAEPLISPPPHLYAPVFF